MTTDIKIIEADDKNILNITSLFHRFFEEEGFFKYQGSNCDKYRSDTAK